MFGRHRSAVDVRRDGLAAVLGPLLHHPAVRSAALVDVGSGMLLDAAVDPAVDAGVPGADANPPTDPEVLGALHADLVRAATELLGPPGSGDGSDGDVLVDSGPAGHHVVRILVDPHGGHLALTAVVVGSRRVAERVRRRLRRVSAEALTAGPAGDAQRRGAPDGPRPGPPTGPPPPGPPRAAPGWSTPAVPPRSPQLRPAGGPATGRPPGTVPTGRSGPGAGPGRSAAPPFPAAPSAVPPFPVPPFPVPPSGGPPSGGSFPRPPGPPVPGAARPPSAPAPAGPAMALLPHAGAGEAASGAAGPVRSPAAALEAPAPVPRLLRPVGPRAVRPPTTPAPPSALPPSAPPPPAPAPPAGGAGR